MFPVMMDPEMIRLAQKHMSRMSPSDQLSMIQQQMMSNSELMKMASDSMKNMKADDLRRVAEQLKFTQPDPMAEIGAKMANATRGDFAINCQLNAANKLKQTGNQLHSKGLFNEALEKYLKAKNNLKDIPSSKRGTLILACSLNLMSCYLKTNQFDKCIKEGIEVLAIDSRNVKALYRRGQAYKSLGQLENAVSDFEKALEFSPDDETIADVLRAAKEKLTEHNDKDIHTPAMPYSESSSQKTEEISKQMNRQSDYFQSLKDDKESVRLNTSSNVQERCENSSFNEDIDDSSSSSFDIKQQIKSQLNNPALREMMSLMKKNFNPDMMTNMSEQFGYKLSREDAERAHEAMSSLSSDSLDKMMKWANRIQGITEGARNTKNWLFGRNGLVMAVTMLLLALFFQGYFGH